MKYKTLAVALPLLVLGLTAFVVPRQGAQEQATLPKSSLSKSQRKVIDTNHFPIVAFSTAEQTDSKRRTRGEKRNKSHWNVDPDALSDSTVVVDSVDVSLPAFPIDQAAAVVIGTITDAKAYLSNDKTGVYSVFTVLIDEVLKSPGSLAVGSLVEAEREGGRVKFPSGRVHLYIVSEQDMPRVGDRYMLFLTKTNSESVFEILTGYELREASVYALDDLPKPRSYEDSTPAEFLNELRMKLAQPTLDVLHYSVTLEPDIAAKSVKGTVRIRFSTESQEVEFNCGDLAINSVRLAGAALKFSVMDHRVRVSLPRKQRGVQEIEIDFHGTPKRGIRFFPDRQQVHTIFFTSQWMVCVDDPADKATLTFKLILPANLTPVANGQLVSQRELPDKKRVSEWQQRTPIPTYIFGFAAGPFHVVKEKRGNVELQYLATNYTPQEVRRIFRDTPDMLDFFEDRAGVKYADRTYTQVLAAGGVEQEMSSFTALKESYGKQLLDNEQDLWLAAHEFAHQWWGNMVTCRDWNHFWLNEGTATFMAAAYLEHRFGRAAYVREIDTYRANYEKVRAAGKDKSLVFPDWLNPTREDRTLVYDKGAYVLHLLREEMGERAFWNGLRLFTRKHFGKSVVTSDFVSAMEEANGKSLKDFFAKWVYLN